MVNDYYLCAMTTVEHIYEIDSPTLDNYQFSKMAGKESVENWTCPNPDERVCGGEDPFTKYCVFVNESCPITNLVVHTKGKPPKKADENEYV